MSELLISIQKLNIRKDNSLTLSGSVHVNECTYVLVECKEIQEWSLFGKPSTRSWAIRAEIYHFLYFFFLLIKTKKKKKKKIHPPLGCLIHLQSHFNLEDQVQYLLTQYLFLFDHHLPGYLRKLDFRCSGESPILSSSTQHSWCLPALLCAKEPGLGNNHLNTNALRDSNWESIIGKKKRIWHNIASNQRNENQNINLAKIKKILSSADQFVVKGSILIYCGRNVN